MPGCEVVDLAGISLDLHFSSSTLQEQHSEESMYWNGLHFMLHKIRSITFSWQNGFISLLKFSWIVLFLLLLSLRLSFECVALYRPDNGTFDPVKSSHPLPWKLSLQTVISFLIISYWIHDERINKSLSILRKLPRIQLLYFHQTPCCAKSFFFLELVYLSTLESWNLIATEDIVALTPYNNCTCKYFALKLKWNV